MDVSKTSAVAPPQTQSMSQAQGSGDVDQSRDQAKKNALNSIQAKYGEKPKEERPIKKQLDKDDFMRIMISEMKHQDPTKPMDAEKMATQMAQLTSVEQLKNVSAAVDRLADKNNASDRLAMSAMIGKSITVDKSRFNHTKGTQSAVNFELPEAAQKVKLTILDEHGEEVAVKELEPQGAGQNVYNWDGINESGVQVKSGTFLVRVDAENAKGNKLHVDPISHSAIVGVSFENGETNFLVGDSKNPQRVGFKNVIKIDGDANMNGAGKTPAKAREVIPGLEDKIKAAQLATANGNPGMVAGAENAVQNGGAQNNKEAGAANSDGPSPNDIMAALAGAQKEVNKPEGFANGLHE